MFCIKKVLLCQNSTRYVSSASFGFKPYILSAARTPVGLKNGSLNEFSAPQLCSFALKEALQRAAVPLDDVRHVFLGCLLYNSSGKEIIKRTGLPKTTKVTSVSASNMKSFIEALSFLYYGNKNICIAAGMESVSNLPFTERHEFVERLRMKQKDVKSVFRDDFLNSNNMNIYLKQDHNNYIIAKKNGAFLDEIIKIDFKKKGHNILVAEDEASEDNINLFENSQEESVYSPVLCDGAAALVISTEHYIKDNELTPLAKIISFVEEPINTAHLPSSLLSIVEKTLKEAKCQSHKIARWEIDSTLGDIIFACVNHFKINSSHVNKEGSNFSMGYPIGMSGIRALCHLTHSLSPGDLGFCLSCDFSKTISAVVIKKFSRKAKVTEKPKLTIYSKKSCLLCEEIKDQLKPFEERFVLKEINIETDYNKKFNDLYKYEVPVLFLDGRFLCKHTLDENQFLRRLSELEKLGNSHPEEIGQKDLNSVISDHCGKFHRNKFKQMNEVDDSIRPLKDEDFTFIKTFSSDFPPA